MTSGLRARPLHRLLCGWFGCVLPPPEDPVPIGHARCARCDKALEYVDLVAESRHERCKAWVRCWFWRKWWPARCLYCGHRYRCDESIDHIPF